MSGRLTVIGLGPGPAEWLTPAASAALAEAEDVLGYHAYVQRLSLAPHQRVLGSDNREELGRAREALDLAASGRRVAVVSGGDPGVFAMAAAVLEAVDKGPAGWRALDIRIEPGVTAMLAAAARVGAPLGHDFCAISLSDNLKPWVLVERRLRLAAEAGFVMALYNVVSKARPDGLARTFALLAGVLPKDTPVVLATAVGRPDQSIAVVPLCEAPHQPADMRTLVIIGSPQTRLVERPAGRPWVYTPRFAEEA